MKIVKVEDLHCDAGWPVNSFLKITTDEGHFVPGCQRQVRNEPGCETVPG
jgi:hypothetical protein